MNKKAVSILIALGLVSGCIGLIVLGIVLVNGGIGPKPSLTPTTVPAMAVSLTRATAATPSSTALFTVYYPEPFDFHYPDETPENVFDSLNIQATPDEFEPATFAIKAGSSDLNEVKVEASDLEGESGVISKENIDIRVVKVWKQGAPSRFFRAILPGHPEIVDKMDMKSLEVPDILIEDEIHFDSEIVGRVWSLDNLPSIPHLGYARTNIPANTLKQFWITVKVPGDARPGGYEGSVSIFVDSSHEASLGLNLRVLPFTLVDADENLFIDMTNFVGPFYHYQMPIFVKAFEDIHDHGINSIDLRLVDLSDNELNTIFVLLNQYEINKNVTIVNKGLSASEARKIVNKGVEADIESYFYGYDEPWDKPPRMPYPCGLALQVKASKDIHEKGGKVVTQITKKYADELADCNSQLYHDLETFDPSICRGAGRLIPKNFTFGTVCEPLDMSYDEIWFREETRYMDSNMHKYIKQIQQDPQSKAPYPEIYYYNPAYVLYPFENRLLFGFFLFNSGLDGARAWVYQRTINDPYDDFDGNQVDANLVYPSREGVIPTYGWEAIREGIDDLRYTETADSMIREVELSDPEKGSVLRQRFNDILAPFVALTYDDNGTDPWKKCDKLLTINELRIGSISTACENSKRIDELYHEKDLRIAREQIIDLILEVAH